MMNEIRKKIWDIKLVVMEIKKFPQTYKTILKDCYDDGTLQFLLRKKLNKLQKRGIICKTNIPGTRFGKCIFYSFKKDYYIIVESSRIGSNVYVFFNYNKPDKTILSLTHYWMLNDGIWVEKFKEKKLNDGNILKFL